MLDRRQSARNKVIYGGVAEIAEGGGASRECVVRNISKDGAHLEFSNNHFAPAKGSIRLMITKKGRSVLAKIVWWRDNFVGVAFQDSCELPGSDLAIRLRRSEKKKRELQRRIRELIGES